MMTRKLVTMMQGNFGEGKTELPFQFSGREALRPASRGHPIGRRARSRLLTLAALQAGVITAGLVGQTARAEVDPCTLDPGDLASGQETTPAGVDRRNILLIIADDVGVDKIETYVDYFNFETARTDDNINLVTTIDGSEVSVLPAETPTISDLADAGVMFVNAWACPTCSPTRASIMTGTHPFRHGVYNPKDADKFSLGDPTTIAEVLSEAPAGYASGLFGKWHLGDPTVPGGVGLGPVDHGWSIHKGFYGGSLPDYDNWTKVSSYGSGCTYDTVLTGQYAPTVNVADAVFWINNQSRPWMATVAFNAAHSVGGEPGTLVNQQPPPGCGSSATPTDQDEVYRSTIECMDAKIADLLSGIDAAELAKTTIIFMGDNGATDDRTIHFDADRFVGVSHAKGTPFEGGVIVPLIIADGYRYLLNKGQQAINSGGTGRVINPGRISEALVQAVDLFATIADIAGADKSCGVDAVSLIPLLRNTTTSVRPVSFVEMKTTATPPKKKWAVRSLVPIFFGSYDYKLVVDESGAPPVKKLYNLSLDRWEKTALPITGASAAAQFNRLIVTILEDHKDDILDVADGCP